MSDLSSFVFGFSCTLLSAHLIKFVRTEKLIAIVFILSPIYLSTALVFFHSDKFGETGADYFLKGLFIGLAFFLFIFSNYDRMRLWQKSVLLTSGSLCILVFSALIAVDLFKRI